MQSHSTRSRGKSWICQHCSKEFKCEAVYKMHLNECNKDVDMIDKINASIERNLSKFSEQSEVELKTNLQNERQILGCPQCMLSFNSQTKLDLHTKEVHTNDELVRKSKRRRIGTYKSTSYLKKMESKKLKTISMDIDEKSCSISENIKHENKVKDISTNNQNKMESKSLPTSFDIDVKLLSKPVILVSRSFKTTNKVKNNYTSNSNQMENDYSEAKSIDINKKSSNISGNSKRKKKIKNDPTNSQNDMESDSLGTQSIDIDEKLTNKSGNVKRKKKIKMETANSQNVMEINILETKSVGINEKSRKKSGNLKRKNKEKNNLTNNQNEMGMNILVTKSIDINEKSPKKSVNLKRKNKEKNNLTNSQNEMEMNVLETKSSDINQKSPKKSENLNHMNEVKYNSPSSSIKLENNSFETNSSGIDEISHNQNEIENNNLEERPIDNDEQLHSISRKFKFKNKSAMHKRQIVSQSVIEKYMKLPDGLESSPALDYEAPTSSNKNRNMVKKVVKKEPKIIGPTFLESNDSSSSIINKTDVNNSSFDNSMEDDTCTLDITDQDRQQEFSPSNFIQNEDKIRFDDTVMTDLDLNWVQFRENKVVDIVINNQQVAQSNEAPKIVSLKPFNKCGVIMEGLSAGPIILESTSEERFDSLKSRIQHHIQNSMYNGKHILTRKYRPNSRFSKKI